MVVAIGSICDHHWNHLICDRHWLPFALFQWRHLMVPSNGNVVVARITVYSQWCPWWPMVPLSPLVPCPIQSSTITFNKCCDIVNRSIFYLIIGEIIKLAWGFQLAPSLENVWRCLAVKMLVAQFHRLQVKFNECCNFTHLQVSSKSSQESGQRRYADVPWVLWPFNNTRQK